MPKWCSKASFGPPNLIKNVTLGHRMSDKQVTKFLQGNLALMPNLPNLQGRAGWDTNLRVMLGYTSNGAKRASAARHTCATARQCNLLNLPHMQSVWAKLQQGLPAARPRQNLQRQKMQATRQGKGLDVQMSCPMASMQHSSVLWQYSNSRKFSPQQFTQRMQTDHRSPHA